MGSSRSSTLSTPSARPARPISRASVTPDGSRSPTCTTTAAFPAARWSALPSSGFSTDVKAGKVQIIVVYKVDRLTRSLADFAKIVDVLDAHKASFVSVTQQFNTTTSMGRLTLNMLLSFAQFEREIAGERIRDKIAASKAKGMWMGGNVPLGYDVKDRKLVVNETEASTVRMIFQRYAELGSVALLKAELERLGIVSKRREGAGGALSGGKRFSRGALYLMLQNRIYRGEIVHQGIAYPGQHEAIIDAGALAGSCRTSSPPIGVSARWPLAPRRRVCWRA